MGFLLFNRLLLVGVFLMTAVSSCEGEPGEGFRCTPTDDGESCWDCRAIYRGCKDQCDDAWSCEECEEEYDDCLELCDDDGAFKCESTEPAIVNADSGEFP